MLYKDGDPISQYTPPAVTAQEVVTGTATDLKSVRADYLNGAIIALILSQIGDNTFTVETTDWDTNTDPDTSTDYPYVAEISSALYSADSAPIWQASTTSGVPSSSDKIELQKVAEAWFDTTGITLYATALPGIDILLQVKGV